MGHVAVEGCGGSHRGGVWWVTQGWGRGEVGHIGVEWGGVGWGWGWVMQG